ncbi:unnamed protein product [Hapterophycus canaliculatus]
MSGRTQVETWKRPVMPATMYIYPEEMCDIGCLTESGRGLPDCFLLNCTRLAFAAFTCIAVTGELAVRASSARRCSVLGDNTDGRFRETRPFVLHLFKYGRYVARTANVKTGHVFVLCLFLFTLLAEAWLWESTNQIQRRW